MERSTKSDMSNLDADQIKNEIVMEIRFFDKRIKEVIDDEIPNQNP